MMTILNRSFLLLCMLLISGLPSYSSVDSVNVKNIEVANDSLGPWTLNVQEIDSIDNNGVITAKSKRKWDGANWINDRTESFYYDLAGNLSEYIKFIWDGSIFIPQIKREMIYDGTGNLLSEISYQFNAGNWVANTKKEHLLSQQSKDSIITDYIQLGGNWNPTNQLIFEYNINSLPVNVLSKSWNGSQWDTISLKSHSYNAAGSSKTTDSVFFYLSPHYLLSQAVSYTYNTSGKIARKINRDFISYQYSDQDTNYIETEIEYEYTIDYLYNSFDMPAEVHGRQTLGSSQSWVFEHKYFQYNDKNLISGFYSHEGTNVTETFSRNSSYYYKLFNANFSVSGISCSGCMDGSVELTAIGGVPGYQIKITPDAGTISGTKIDNLASGTYTVCISDALGNEICRDVNITGVSTSIDETNKSAINFKVKQSYNNSSLVIETDAALPFEFSLFEASGKLILQKTIMNSMEIISLNSISGGLYFYKAKSSSLNKGGVIISGR
ncbi:MAG: hypothetical protein EYC69_03365 [Bacteroidetes bacterium]|nr:MAG: hypothetical protein EYC69_03365 [Bacteroidota bacterium]